MRPTTRSRRGLPTTGLARLFAVVALLLAMRGTAAAQEASDTRNVEIVTAPVTLDGLTVMHLRGASSMTAETRARLVSERLRAVATNPAVSADSVRIADDGSTTRIVAGDALIVTVTDADADLEQVRRSELASIHEIQVKRAIDDYRAARTPDAIQRSIGRGIVATILLLGAIVFLRWWWGWVDRWLKRKLKRHVESVESHSFQVMRAEQIWTAVRGALLTVRSIVFLVLLLSYVDVMLALLPWSRGLSQNIVTFVLGPVQVMGQGLIAHFPGLMFLAVLFLIVRVLLRLLHVFFEGVRRGTVTLANFEPEWAQPTHNLVRIAVVAFAIVVAYPYIPGSDTAAFQGVSVFVGIVFSLGSSSAIANVLAGYMITYRRALKVGDRVKIGESFGEVIEMSLQVTRLRSIKNEEIVIPNSQIISGEVFNYSSLSKERGLILHTEVGIGYATPWRQVEALLLTAARRTDGIMSEPEPFILERRLGEFAVTYELNAYTKEIHMMTRLYAALHRNILDVFNEHGVQIMTPAYEGDPAEPKVVARENWYTAPARPSQSTASTST